MLRALGTAVLLVSVAILPVQAQTVRTIALVDFENISVDSGLIHQAHLSRLLEQLLQRQGAQVRVVPSTAVRDALRARGWRPADLISPGRAAELAQAVGAEWVVTGLWTQLRVISRATPEDPSGIREGDAFAIASVTVRVMDGASRRRIFEGWFDGASAGGGFGSLYLAAYQALAGAASRIARL
jgi:hypothetical protein